MRRAARLRPSVPILPPPFPGGNADIAGEDLGHVALIPEPAHQSDLGQAVIAGLEQALDAFNAAGLEPSVGRSTNGRTKRSREISNGKVALPREFGDRHLAA